MRISTPASQAGSYFYSAMSLVIAGVVVYGFSHTIDAGLLQPANPPPPILYFHGVIFGGWVVLLMIQSALIRIGNVALHRRLGIAGAALGIAIPAVGIATAVAMGRIHAQLGSADEPQFLVVSFYDMAAFLVPFALALLLRRRPEFHRRLMFIASCTLTVAAFNRFPVVPANWGFAGVDLLILIGVARDWFVTGVVHPTYVYGLPAIILGQAAALYVYLNAVPGWVRFAQRLIG